EVKYKAEATLSVNDEVKIFKSNDGNAWNYSNFEEGSVGVNCELTSDGNIKIKRAGNYTVYLRMHKDGGTSVRVFYVAPQPADTATAKLNTMAMIDESATRIPADADREKLTKWYVLENVTLQANTKIKFYVNDQEVSGLFRVSSQLINGGVSGDNTMGVEFTMPKAGTFEFHLKYYIGEGWKVWIHGTLDNPTPPTPDTDPNASLTYGSATGKFAEDGYTGGYLVGKFTAKNHTSFGTAQWDNGYQMTFDSYNFKITVYLKAGDVVKVRVNVGDGSTGAGYAKLDDANKNSLNGIVSNDDDDNFVIGKDGYYSFTQWYSNNPDGGGMSLTYSETKPNGGNEGGGGGNQSSKDIAGYVYKEVNSNNYFLVGGFVGEAFDWNNGYEMKTKDNGEYMVEGFTVTAGSGVKIRIGDENFGYANVHAEWGNKDWVEEDSDGNIVFKESGTYKIYINPDSKDIYISK
ncbi:MAG: hypothetical protein K2I75_06725, partial [Clostridiales bacterium]|nr:hypothetical protein [Clostridiales bacterium]